MPDRRQKHDTLTFKTDLSCRIVKLYRYLSIEVDQSIFIIMMDECDDDIGSTGNPFECDKIQEESKPDTVASSPDKQSQDIDMNSNKNPFEDDNIGDLHNVYERVSLTATVSNATGALNRDWDSEWEHVASCVKRNFTCVSVVSPEVISTIMTK